MSGQGLTNPSDNFEPCYCVKCDGKLPAPCRYGTGQRSSKKLSSERIAEMVEHFQGALTDMVLTQPTDGEHAMALAESVCYVTDAITAMKELQQVRDSAPEPCALSTKQRQDLIERLVETGRIAHREPFNVPANMAYTEAHKAVFDAMGAAQPPGALRPGLERAEEIISAIETPADQYEPYKSRLLDALRDAIHSSETKEGEQS